MFRQTVPFAVFAVLAGCGVDESHAPGKQPDQAQALQSIKRAIANHEDQRPPTVSKSNAKYAVSCGPEVFTNSCYFLTYPGFCGGEYICPVALDCTNDRGQECGYEWNEHWVYTGGDFYSTACCAPGQSCRPGACCTPGTEIYQDQNTDIQTNC